MSRSPSLSLSDNSGNDSDFVPDEDIFTPISVVYPPPPPQNPRQPRTKSRASKPRFTKPYQSSSSQPGLSSQPQPPQDPPRRAPTAPQSQQSKRPRTSEPDSVPQTSAIPDPETLSSWFLSPEEEENYRLNFHNRDVFKPYRYDKVFFSTWWSFPHLIRKVENFLALNYPIYPDLVRAFYSTLSIEDRVLTATIKKKQIRITPSRWTAITGIDWEGSLLEGDALPEALLTEFFVDQGKELLCHVGAMTKVDRINSTHLTTNNRILFIILIKILTPRGGNFTQPNSVEKLALWALNKNININWSHYIQKHMMTCKNDPTFALPYATLVSHLIHFFNINVDGEKSFQVTDWHYVIGKSFVNKAHIVCVDGAFYHQKYGDRSNIPIALARAGTQPAEDPVDEPVGASSFHSAGATSSHPAAPSSSQPARDFTSSAVPSMADLANMQAAITNSMRDQFAAQQRHIDDYIDQSVAASEQRITARFDTQMHDLRTHMDGQFSLLFAKLSVGGPSNFHIPTPTSADMGMSFGDINDLMNDPNLFPNQPQQQQQFGVTPPNPPPEFP